jgi:2-polyprenyl-3-methyl-5-hydroxy-6-metoxy-1,4-benzoquinol methylase
MIDYKVCPNCSDSRISNVFSVKDFTVSNEEFEIWECENCSQRFTQNIPSEEEIGKYYQSENYISHSDISKGLVNDLYHKVRKRTLVQKRKLVEKETGKTFGNILDIGAGTGAFLNTMKLANWSSTGLEPDETARKKALELYNIHLKKTEEFVSLPSESFDAITMWHVLEHVHDLHEYLEQLKSLIKPTGKIFIAVPNYTSFDSKHYQQFWAAYDVPRHLYHFSPKSMQKLLSIHDLKLDKMKPMWYDSVYVSMLSEQYKTGASHPANALFLGFISNLKALANTARCSSVIYIISK